MDKLAAGEEFVWQFGRLGFLSRVESGNHIFCVCSTMFALQLPVEAAVAAIQLALDTAASIGCKFKSRIGKRDGSQRQCPYFLQPSAEVDRGNEHHERGHGIFESSVGGERIQWYHLCRGI